MENNSDNLSNLNSKDKVSEETKRKYELSFYDEDDFFDVDDWLYGDGEDFLKDS